MNISVLRFDRNIFLIAAVGLVGNGHAKLSAFQQGLEVCFNKMVLVFQSTHGHDFFTAFRLRTESQNRCDCAGVCGAICGGDWCGATTVAA